MRALRQYNEFVCAKPQVNQFSDQSLASVFLHNIARPTAGKCRATGGRADEPSVGATEFRLT